MNPKNLRNAIAAQCGFNKAKQGEHNKPEPTSFSEWLEQNQDSIECCENCTEIDGRINKAKDEPLPF